jgi:hypothetical protein
MSLASARNIISCIIGKADGSKYLPLAAKNNLICSSFILCDGILSGLLFHC